MKTLIVTIASLALALAAGCARPMPAASATHTTSAMMCPPNSDLSSNGRCEPSNDDDEVFSTP